MNFDILQNYYLPFFSLKYSLEKKTAFKNIFFPKSNSCSS